MKQELPVGYSLDKEGRFIHKLAPEEIEEMRRQDRLVFTLATLNILQAIFITILVLSHFCNH